MELHYVRNAMTKQKPNKTQQSRLLELLKIRGVIGVKVYEMMTPRPNGLGISQYGARILELRKKGHVIENKKPGHFVLTDQDENGQLKIK